MKCLDDQPLPDTVYTRHIPVFLDVKTDVLCFINAKCYIARPTEVLHCIYVKYYLAQ